MSAGSTDVGQYNGGDEFYGKISKSNYADEDDADVDDEDDEFGADYDEGLSIDDFGNVWEGMLEKQGKAMLNKVWRPRWCSIRGPRFEYFEDHTKRKSLGTVPLELATWELANATSMLTVRTLGRDDKSGEKSGRAFYFRFLGDSDRTGFFNALHRAAYLRHREMLLEACRTGDAFGVHQVLHHMRVLGHDEQSPSSSSSSSQMAVCQPVAFAPDYDQSAAGGAEVPSTLLGSILHEASSSTQQSCVHLAVLSGDLLPWGDSKAAQHLAQQLQGVPPPIPLAALKGHGPHPVATLRLLLSPLPTVDLADCAFLLRAPGQDARFASMSQPLLQEHSRFLLEVVDGVGDTPLAAALKAQPFRESHLGKDSADSSAAAQHTALRSSSRCGASLYDIDPRSILGLPPSSAQSGAGGRTATGASTNKLNSLASTKSMLSSSSSSIRLESTRSVKTLARSALQSSTGSSVALDFGTGGLACALTLLSAGSRPATLNDHGCSPLHVAAAAPEHVAALRALLDVNGGADVNAQDAAGCSPLMHAAMTNNGAGAEALLALGANLDARSWKNGYTALAWAARCGADSVSTLLLDEDRRLLLLQNAPQLLNNGAGKGGLGAPPLPVSTASANTWLYAGAQVTWRGADQDLPEGTVGAVEAVHSDGDVEVLFPTLSGPKTFTFKADRLAPATESSNSSDGGWIDDMNFDDDSSGSSRSGKSKRRVPLVQVADSRGDLPIHLLARAYVAKSREASRLKNATLAQFTSLLSALLAEMPLESSSQEGGGIAKAGGGSVNAKGHDGRTPLLILSRAEAEPANLDLVGSTATLLLEHGASVHVTTSGGHTPLHLAADVGNHTLCRALVEKGADPNAQSLEGMTPYGYVRKRLASPPGGGATNGHSSSNGRGSVAGGSSAANQGSDCLAVTRMLQRTSEVLLELGAYKMERSALAIEQDSVTAQWMKGADGSHQLRAATAPKLIAYLVKPTTSRDDVVAFTLQFHRTLRDDKDPFLALAVLLQLLKQSYDSAGVISAEGASSSGGAGGVSGGNSGHSSGAAAVAVRVGVWSVLNCVLEMRLSLFPDPTASPTDGNNGSGGAGANSAQNEDRESEDEDDEGDDHSSSRVQEASPEQRNAVRRALRDLVATTVRSGLPDALTGGSKTTSSGKGASSQPKLDSVYRYAKLAADAGDPIWAAFLSREPLTPCAMLLALPPVSPAAGNGTYRAVLQLANAALAPSSTSAAATAAAHAGGGAGAGPASPRSLPQLLQLAAPTSAEVEKGLLAFTPQQLASHITILTHALFCAIPVSEFGDKRYGKGQTQSPRFHALKDLVLRLQYVCISEIVCRTELKTRAASVALLVRTAEACLQCNNFDGAVLVVGVLCDASIHRLRKTWEVAEALIPKHWDAVQHAVGMAGRSLEAAMAELTADPPCMPAVGFIIKNLVNLDERPEFVEGSTSTSTSSSGGDRASRASADGKEAENGGAPPPPPPSLPSLVNFDRIRRIGAVFNVVTTAQRVPYPFGDQLHPTLLALLLSPPLYGDEEATYDQSKRVEAKSKPKKNSGT